MKRHIVRSVKTDNYPIDVLETSDLIPGIAGPAGAPGATGATGPAGADGDPGWTSVTNHTLTTTDATATDILAELPPLNTITYYEVMIIGFCAGPAFDFLSQRTYAIILCADIYLILEQAGNIGTFTNTTVGFSLGVTGDSSTGRVHFTCTGVAGKTINWKATVKRFQKPQ